MAVFTKEFRDRHFRKCRYGTDPRTCNSCYIPKGRSLTELNQAVCERDGVDCDVRWEEADGVSAETVIKYHSPKGTHPIFP
ncbi:hypothetical protein ES703_62093 [subsurface metagenome]